MAMYKYIGVGNVGAVGAIALTLFGLRCSGVTAFSVRISIFVHTTLGRE